jgi:hypothetical protein
MYPISSEGLNKETDKGVFFFTTSFYPLDNFSAHVIEIWGQVFPTAEHAYHWKKFSQNPEVSRQILAARSPEAAKRIADEHKDEIPKGWHDQKVEVMKEIFRAKAGQHEDVREALQRSGNREIIENSPVDSFWGSGPDKNGQNVIGKIWMEIKKKI